MIVKVEVDIQQRQLVIEERQDGSLYFTVRFDGESMRPHRLPRNMTLKNAQRYGAECQLGRASEEVSWTFNEINGVRVWYSDTFLTINGGTRPTAAEIAAYQKALPRKKGAK